MQQNWFNKYIGIPYKDKGRDPSGLDCWGLVRHVYSNEFNIDLPSFIDSYTTAHSRSSVAEAIAINREGWVRVENPLPGDVILISTVGKEDHVGIYTMPGYFLHALQGNQVVMEVYQSPKWRNRVEGFYRYSEKLPSVEANLIPSPLCTKKLNMAVKEGLSISELVQKVKEENSTEITQDILDCSDIVVVLNGNLVDKTEWHILLKAEDIVEYRIVAKGGSGGGIFKIFATILIAVVAWYAAPYIAGAMGAVAPTATAAGVGLMGMSYGATTALVAGAINMVGGLLLNAIFPTRPPNTSGGIKDAGTSAAYKAISGSSNNVQQYSCLPVVLGKMKFAPPAAAQPYMDNKTTYNILNMCVTWGYGPLAISRTSLKLDNRSLDTYGGLQSRTYDGYYDDSSDFTFSQALSLYGKEIIQRQVDLETKRIIWEAKSITGDYFNEITCNNMRLTWSTSSNTVIITPRDKTDSADLSMTDFGYDVQLNMECHLQAKNTSGLYDIIIGRVSKINETSVELDISTGTDEFGWEKIGWILPNFYTKYGTTGTGVSTIVAKAIFTNKVEYIMPEKVDQIEVDILFPSGCRGILTEGGSAGMIIAMPGNHSVYVQPVDDFDRPIPGLGYNFLAKSGNVANTSISTTTLNAKPTLSSYINQKSGLSYTSPNYFLSFTYSYSKKSAIQKKVVINESNIYYYIVLYADKDKNIQVSVSSTTNSSTGDLPETGSKLRELYNDIIGDYTGYYDFRYANESPSVQGSFTDPTWVNWAKGFRSLNSVVKYIEGSGGTLLGVYKAINDVVQPSSVYSYDINSTIYTSTEASCTCVSDGSTIVSVLINTTKFNEFSEDRVIYVEFPTGVWPASGTYIIDEIIQKDDTGVLFNILTSTAISTSTASCTVKYSPFTDNKTILFNPSLLKPTFRYDSVLDGNYIIIPDIVVQNTIGADPKIVCGDVGQKFYKRKNAFNISAVYNVDNTYRYKVVVQRTAGHSHDYCRPNKNYKISVQAQSKVLAITGRKNSSPIISSNLLDSDGNPVPLAITTLSLVGTNQVNGNTGGLTGIAQTICKDYTGSDIKSISRNTDGSIIVNTNQKHLFNNGEYVRFSNITNTSFTYLNTTGTIVPTVMISTSADNLYSFTGTPVNFTSSGSISLTTNIGGECLISPVIVGNKAVWDPIVSKLYIDRSYRTPINYKNGWLVELSGLVGLDASVFNNKSYRVSNITTPLDSSGMQIELTPVTSISSPARTYELQNIKLTTTIYNTDWVLRPTSNNASLFRYVMQHPGNIKRCSDNRIDLDMLAYWSKFCRLKGFEFNSLIVSSAQSLDSVLRDISAAGMASPTYANGKWSVVIDEPRTRIVQHFTPYNSWGFEGNRVLAKRPHAFRIPYFNAEKDWAQDECIVCDTGYYESFKLIESTISIKAVSTVSIVPDLVYTNTIDGVSISSGDIVLLTNQGNNSGNGVSTYYGSSANGLYVVTSSGTWNRHENFPDSSYFYNGDLFTITSGVLYSGKKFVQVEDPTSSSDPVRFDPYVGPPTVYETLELPGITNYAQAKYLARFHMAQSRLRPETYSINVDFEYLVCTRGDLVRVSHDVPLWGTASGRFYLVEYDNVNLITKLHYDDPIYLEATESYNIRVRASDSSSYTYTVIPKEVSGEYNTIEVEGDISSTIFDGDLFMLGTVGKESNECIVLNIEPMDNNSAKLTLVDYAPEIYDIAMHDNPILYQDTGITPNNLHTTAKISMVPKINQFISDERVMVKNSDGTYSYGLGIVFSLSAERYKSLKADNIDRMEIQVGYSSTTPELGNDLYFDYSKTVDLINGGNYVCLSSKDPDSIIELGETYRIRARYLGAENTFGPWTSVDDFIGLNNEIVGDPLNRQTYIDTYATGYTEDNLSSYVLRFEVVGPSTVPKNISSLSVTPVSTGIRLSWPALAEVDITKYEVRTQDSNWGETEIELGVPNTHYTGATSSNSLNVLLPSLSISDPTSISYTYYTRGVDILNQYSTASASTVFTYYKPSDVPDPKLNVLSTSGKAFSATYTISGTNCVITKKAHGLKLGDVLMLDFSTGNGVDGKYTVTSASTNTFIVAHSSMTTSGTLEVISAYSKRTILFDWEPVDSSTGIPVAGYEIRTVDSDWGGDQTTQVYKGSNSQAQIGDVPVGVTSTWYLRAFDTLGTYSHTSRILTYESLRPNNITSATLSRSSTNLVLSIVATKPSDFEYFRVKIGKVNDGILEGTDGLNGTNDFWSDPDVIYEEDLTTTVKTIPLNIFNNNITGSSIYTTYRCAVRMVDKSGNESPNSYICSYLYTQPSV